MQARAQQSRKRNLDKARLVTAQVLVRSKSGRQVSGEAEITSLNLAEYEPSVDDASNASDAFKAAGFKVGNLAGISFSVTAPVGTFETFFACQLRLGPDDAVQVVCQGQRPGYELPLTALAACLAKRIATVTFNPPGSFFPAVCAAMS